MQVVAHRGLAAGAPENSIAAIQAALDAGFGYIEVDVRWSADGVPLLMHDAAIDRTTSGSGQVRELEWRALRELRLADGSAVPSLAEALDLVGGRAVICLDTKTAAQLETLADLVACRPAAVEVWSGDPRV